MTSEQIQQKAERVYKKYNPEGLSPFPFHSIQEEKKDFRIITTQKLTKDVSGIIEHLSENFESKFVILINGNSPLVRQQFTIAHELGHYFLHQEEIKKGAFVDADNVLDCVGVLYRRDNNSTELEAEANSFAASLLMPEGLVKKVWKRLKDIEECAQVFNVSVEAMSIRLSRLGLVV